MRKKEGFTLIELLIVVAIIAILAAIAVPNFLEAQVRSKVSRVKNDQRTLATGIEAYYVDFSDFLPNTSTSLIPGSFTILPLLSTPTAYVTNSVIEDAFGNRTPAFSGISPILYFKTAHTDTVNIAHYVMWDAATAAGQAGAVLPYDEHPLIDNSYMIISAGPDRLFTAQEMALHEVTVFDPGTVANPGPGDFGNAMVLYANGLSLYDPSNGTVSSGDIIRTRRGIFSAFLAGVGGL